MTVAPPYIAELRIVGFDFAPRGWALCNGQLLPINQNQALFALLGTTYGGDGRVTFALPDLRGAAALHTTSTYPLGLRGGEDTHVLATAELASHTHVARSTGSPATDVNPKGTTWADTGALKLYSRTADLTLGVESFATAGASQAHPNLPPYLVLNVIIALVGEFPPRN